MINHEAIRMFMRAYRKTTSEELTSMMETDLMNLLDKQAEFERAHQAFVAHILFMARENFK